MRISRTRAGILDWAGGGHSWRQTSHVSGRGKQKSKEGRGTVCREQVRRSREAVRLDLLFEEIKLGEGVRGQAVARRGFSIKALVSVGWV